MFEQGGNNGNRKRTVRRSAFAVGGLALFFAQYGLAGSVKIAEGCPDLPKVKVETKRDTSLSTFVELTKPKSKDMDYRITYNPKFPKYYFNRHTQQWLYLRQCAHIVLRHEFDLLSKGRLNPRWERDADCWAIKHMRDDKEKYRFTEKGIRIVERDLKSLEKKDRRTWEQLFGSRHEIDLDGCIRKRVQRRY